jgi:hypothetical protein
MIKEIFHILTSGPMHNVRHLILTIVCPASCEHALWIIAHHHNLPTRWKHLCVLNTAQLERSQSCAVDDNGCTSAGVMHGGCVANVGGDAAAHYHAVLQALA